MMPIAADNVFLDRASAYQWSELNETVFLERFFRCLAQCMGERFQEYTYYVLSSHHPDVIPQSAAFAGPRKVLFFISDESSSIPTALHSKYFAIFKCYLPSEVPGTNIFSFTLGYVRGVPECVMKPAEERTYDVFFSGSLHSGRLAFYREMHPVLKRLPPKIANRILIRLISGSGRRFLNNDPGIVFPRSYIRFTDAFKAGLTPESYGMLLSDSKIVLCPKGARSAETFRHMEAIRAGAVAVSESLPNTHFYRGSPIVQVPDWRSGFRVVRRIVADPDLLGSLQSKTIAWWRDVCSESATAHYVSRTLLQHEGTSRNPQHFR